MHNVAHISIRDTSAGAVVAVKVVPGSSRDRIVGVLGDCLKITTATAAQKGKANAAVAGLLARAIGAAAGAVELVGGSTSPRKEFIVRGWNADELRRALERV
jgi:uncharacterized protein (TIGR00251 family)